MMLPLHVACSTGNRNTVKKIIESVPLNTLETKDETGKTPLMLSVMYNQMECVSLLLKAGVHIDNTDSAGQTALHIAINKGFHRIVKLLLSYNACSQQKDFYGVTPLHLAAIHTNPKCLSLMLKDIKPGEIDVQDSSKKTALHWCSSYSNEENIRVLLMKDANTCIPDEDGKTPLHYAATSSNIKALECVKILLEKEGNLINWQDYDGSSALHLAVSTGSIEVVRFLVCREDCNIDILDNSFCTPLHLAAAKGYYEKVDVLLSARANHTSADGNEATALHYAACNNHAKTVEVFLSRSYVSADVEDTDGRNALIWSAASNADDVIKVMASYRVNLLYADRDGITALHAAAVQGHETTVELLLNLQVTTELKDKYGMTPLLRACEFGRLKIAQLLINHEANIYQKDSNARSTLHWCAIGGHAYLSQILILKGVDCNSQDAFGMTPLHYACMKDGYLNCVSVLLESKAKLNIVDMEGRTPLHLAVLSDHEGVIKLLCEYDADVNSMMFQNCWITPLDLAVMNDKFEMVKLLRQYGALGFKEIEETAACKIQAWYCTKNNKLQIRKRHLSNLGNTYKRNFDLCTNSALLKRCQHVIEAFNAPSLSRDKNTFKTLSKISLPSKQQNLQADYFGNIDCFSFMGIESHQDMSEMKAAHIIQRAWKRYTLKSKFKKMRKNIETTFKTAEDRNFAERCWQSRLLLFYEHL